MPKSTSQPAPHRSFFEMREFSSFTAREQRFIRRSLDIAQKRTESILSRWSRDKNESAAIMLQQESYDALDQIKAMIPTEFQIRSIPILMGPLIELSALDLAQGSIDSFSAYRFLYERLLGPQVRPWLPGAFCGAAAMPNIEPNRRSTLLQSISESAATAPAWSMIEPTFYPEWIDKQTV
jgi:hypothetical protein